MELNSSTELNDFNRKQTEDGIQPLRDNGFRWTPRPNTTPSIPAQYAMKFDPRKRITPVEQIPLTRWPNSTRRSENLGPKRFGVLSVASITEPLRRSTADNAPDFPKRKMPASVDSFRVSRGSVCPRRRKEARDREYTTWTGNPLVPGRTYKASKAVVDFYFQDDSPLVWQGPSTRALFTKKGAR